MKVVCWISLFAPSIKQFGCVCIACRTCCHIYIFLLVWQLWASSFLYSFRNDPVHRIIQHVGVTVVQEAPWVVWMVKVFISLLILESTTSSLKISSFSLQIRLLFGVCWADLVSFVAWSEWTTSMQYYITTYTYNIHTRIYIYTYRCR